MSFRSRLRPLVPYEVRLWRARSIRWFRDHSAGEKFALAKDGEGTLRHLWAEYERPLIDYPGQEHLAGAKRRNQELLAGALTGTVIAPGETFSVWKLAGRPSKAKGYLKAAALKSGKLTTDTGGAVCLLSTALYNAALLSGMTVSERRCHSVDSYGNGRYFELGRDAAIEFGYTDLRFRNRHEEPVRLEVHVLNDRIRCAIRGSLPMPVNVRIEVSAPDLMPDREEGGRRFAVRTRRVISTESGCISEDLGPSVYRIPRELESEWR